MAEVLCAGMAGLRRLGAGGGAAKAPCWRRLGQGASCGGGSTREIQAYGGCICGKVVTPSNLNFFEIELK